MEQGNKAFNEVRALLGKLDRSIDEARSRRLGPPAQTEPSTTGANPSRSSEIDLDQEIGGSSEKTQTSLQKRGAQFGRAKPLNRENNSLWQNPGENNSGEMQIG
jgi:hypothetical protein